MGAVSGGLMSFLHSLFAFFVILVPLVVFHEFGHFLFAKIFGVKAEIFSVGFGPKLWSRQMGETEFRVSAIPLGGYVKLLGEDRESEISAADLNRSLHRQKPWKRFLIFFGGPLFNFILAIFIFMAVLAIGEPQIASVVGRVVQGSYAEKVGFRSGDRILEIDGKPVKKFEEVLIALNDHPNQSLDFLVMHPDVVQPVHLKVTPSSQSGFSIYGESTPVGEIEGLFCSPRSPTAGVSNSNSTAARGGLSIGDKILKLDQIPIETWEQLEALYGKLKAQTAFTLQFQNSKGKVSELPLVKPLHALGLEKDFGIFSSEMFVEKAVSRSPAEQAGLRAGDRLIGIGNLDVHGFFELKDAVQRSGEKDGKVKVRWERDGKIYHAEVIPTATAGRDPLLNKTVQYTVGIVPMLFYAEPVTFIEKIWNPFTLVRVATERMVTFSWRNLVSMKKMVTGDVSVGTLGGPLMIGKIAGESLARGLTVFLTNMAIFSIGLGVLNILPVPVLDGGHLMLLGVESIRGKPLSLKQMEVVQGFGLVLILALMGIAFRNDLARLFYS